MVLLRLERNAGHMLREFYPCTLDIIANQGPDVGQAVDHKVSDLGKAR